MPYAIKNFKCTPLGKELLANKPFSVELTTNEEIVIKLVYQYHHKDLPHTKKNTIEEQFESLYANVNLTRLVILQLLSFTQQDNQNRATKEDRQTATKEEIKKLTNRVKSEYIDPSLVIASGEFLD